VVVVVALRVAAVVKVPREAAVKVVALEVIVPPAVFKVKFPAPPEVMVKAPLSAIWLVV
jgi:hypothetical protein